MMFREQQDIFHSIAFFGQLRIPGQADHDSELMAIGIPR